MMNDLIAFAVNNGFAVIVALYSLTRLETAMKSNTKALTSIQEVIYKCKNEK